MYRRAQISSVISPNWPNPRAFAKTQLLNKKPKLKQSKESRASQGRHVSEVGPVPPRRSLRPSCSERRAARGGTRGAERSGAERWGRAEPPARPARLPAACPSPPPRRLAAGVRAAGARLELTRAPGVCMQSLHSADPGGCAPLPSDGRSPSRPQGECCCPAQPSPTGACARRRAPCGSGEQQTNAQPRDLEI